MSTEKIHFSNLNDFHTFLDIDAPEHPLFSVCSLSSPKHGQLKSSQQDIVVSSDFYVISLKHIVSGHVFYGRTKYDCQNGTMIFTAPKQGIMLADVTVESKSRLIVFHEDFIRGHKIKDELRKYNYFSYAVNEALHLAPKEKQMIEGMFDQIEVEHGANQDEFSKELILSQLDTLLKYANRYYHRQFLHRKESRSDLLVAFIAEIERLTEAGDAGVKAIPTIEDIAGSMAMTPRYLSDALKIETGKTAIENLHLYMIDKAKDMLLDADATVASVAYNLGFEYPQYFARLFKKKTGMTPTEYRKSYH